MSWYIVERILLVGLGGAIGSISRFGVFMLMKNLYRQGFPVGALTVNVVGSLLMGCVAFLILHRDFEGHKLVETFLVTGFLGGFTTFSAFSFDVLKLTLNGEYLTAGLIIAGNLLLSLAAVFCGFYAASRLIA